MKTKKEELEAELTRLNALRKQVKEKLKALPVYELNRWYKHQNGSLYFINNECEDGHLYGYGFDNDGEWYVRNNDESDFCAFNSVAKKEITEATPQEVEQSLIEEAKRLGHNYDKYSYNTDENTLCGYNGRLEEIFVDGVWNEPYDKFSELKEAHRNGAVIQINNIYGGWSDVVDNSDLWLPNYEYRIKPEEKPKVGDVVKVWDDDEDVYLIGCITDIDISSSFPFLLYDYDWFKHAKTLTQQEAIDLLFNKGAN